MGSLWVGASGGELMSTNHWACISSVTSLNLSFLELTIIWQKIPKFFFSKVTS